MGQSRLDGDYLFTGTASFKTLVPQPGAISDSHVAAAANIASTKVKARPKLTFELFGPTTTITALTRWLHVVRGAAGTVVRFSGLIAVQATGADRTVTVDLQKSTGGAFATVLTTTVNITNGTTIRTLVNAVINTATLLAGDILQAVVTVAGSAGAQAQGLTLNLELEEEAT